MNFSTSQQKSNKLRALDLRFTEGPKNNPEKLPIHFVAGITAFEFPSPKTKKPSSYFCLDNETFKKDFYILEKEASNLCHWVNVMHSVSKSEEFSAVEELENRLLQLSLYTKSLVQQAKKRKKHLLQLKDKAKTALSDLIIQKSQLERSNELNELLRLSRSFQLESILRPKKEQVLNSIQDDGNQHFKNNLNPLPFQIQKLVKEIKKKQPKGQSKIEEIQVFDDNFLFSEFFKFIPPINDFTLNTCLQELVQLADELKNLKESTGEVKINFLKWINQRFELFYRKNRSDWNKYAHLIQRFRRYIDQETSPYRGFAFLRRDKPTQLLNLLGKGGFAEVWQAFDYEALKLIAVKITDLHPDLTLDERELILSSTGKEVTLQRTLRHPHIVEMQECFEITPLVFAAALDLCNQGSLEMLIRLHGPIPENLACVWTKQILQALVYIHQVGRVVHFDVKPHNILVHNGLIKVADFGLHQPVGVKGFVSLDMKQQNNQVGTVWYMPPEHLIATLLEQYSRFDERFDTWSVGIVLYEMLYSQRPFGHRKNLNGLSCDHVAASICHDFQNKLINFPDSIQDVSNVCKNFIKRLLQPVQFRPKAAEALKDDFFSKLSDAA